MKNLLSLLFFLLQMIASHLLFAQKDLPNPPPDMVMIPAGSYVIPMDTIYQNIVPAGQAPFNLRAYGLVAHFLKSQIPVKWAINSGKNLNDIDFSAMVVRAFPSVDSIPVWMDFRGGPFIVKDTAVCGMSTWDIIQEFGNDVAVYRLTQNTLIDIRYTITHNPKIAIFNNGGNQLIHSKILDAAGIFNYDFMDAANIGSLTDCYTFVSEPHWDISLANPTVINGVKNFVLSGGNFFAQCQAVETYENFGYFMTNLGVTLTNLPVSHSYHNADLAALQIHGFVNENQGGSVSNWTTSTGSMWNGQTYKLVTSNGSDTVVAMGSHLSAPLDPGGNAFFVGCHDYMKDGSNNYDLTDIRKINELRMYLNAVFIPSIDNQIWANAGIDKAVGCTGSAQLGCVATGPPGATYTWTPSTGLSCSNCPNPVASPLLTTSYILTVTNVNGCMMADNVTVTVNTPTIANFAATTVCENNATVFTDQSTGAAVQWNWDFGDGNSSMQQNPSYTFSNPGNYTTSLTVTDNLGCSHTTQQSILVNPLPDVNFNATNVCMGSPTCFSDMSTIANGSITSWSWNFGDPNSGQADTSGQQSPCHLFTQANSNVTLALVSNAGCIDSITIPVSPISLPQAAFTNTSVCINSATNFTDQSVSSNNFSISTWEWNFGDGSSTTSQQHPSHLYNSPGQRNVSLIITSVEGCRDTILRTVSVHDNPVPDFSGAATGCVPVCLTVNDLSNSTDGIISNWQWSFPGGSPSSSNNQNPSVCYNIPGNYDVTLNLTSGFGCTSSLTKSQLIQIHPLPQSDFCVAPNTASLFDPTFSFCEMWSPDVVNWYWNFGDGSMDSISTNPSHSYSLSITNNDFYRYTVTLLVENIFGCTDIKTQEVVVLPEYTFFIPNCFTPNGDYSNKYFYGKGRGIKEYEISIYDRWGILLWNCRANDADNSWDENNPEGLPSACKWDGIYGGSEMQSDVYVWKVKLTTILDKDFSYNGSVTIIK